MAQDLESSEWLRRETFWENRDFEWFEQQIPLFDCPDAELTSTYYYRWELVTRHLTYGSPNSGYSITEFSDRPFWSGAYGSISCPAGHQIYEVRWLRQPRYARDYLRYWFRTPGAQPRRYSFWAADSAWAAHLVHPNRDFIVDLLPDLLANQAAWKERHFVPGMGLFWQTGHDDGMEFDINAQQTQDIVRGGQSLRPSFNAYQWADAMALARIGELAGDVQLSQSQSEFAADLKRQLQSRLWDPQRTFFFPMSQQEHEKDGHVVRRHTLTYESGRFAGSPHGRELHGYVPWAFRMPDEGFEQAWQFLMDPDYFYAPFGPTTVERHDPLFVLKPHCCWWSGQSWPFATTQTLKAMANVLHYYEQHHVDRQDYYKLLHRYAVSHRKEGRPYIAEALHPDTGSWEGHDAANHSEHYFHSGFVDLVITGLIGLQPEDSDQLAIDPLVPEDWDYFALDRVPYRGHLLTVIWDSDGTRYGLGAGWQVLVNGDVALHQAELGKVTLSLPPAVMVPLPTAPLLNYAVNNDGDWYPRLNASHVGPGTSLAFLQDGQYRYDQRPVNRWTSQGSGQPEDWVEVDFGTPRPIQEVKLYLLDDEDQVVAAPEKLTVQYHDGRTWRALPGHDPGALEPLGRQPTSIEFPSTELRRLRVVLQHRAGRASGLTEIEAWGPGDLPYQAPPPPPGNLAFRGPQQEFPRITASHTDRFGARPEMAIDGRLSFAPNPFNRWTSYESPNEEDWLELDFGQPQSIGRVVLHLYDDRGGVQPPRSYRIETWQDQQWVPVSDPHSEPEIPTGSTANTVRFAPVSAQRLRVVFEHRPGSKSGVTELEVWRE